MIVSRRPQGLVLVRQVDHQDQCALMARAWGNGDFALPAPVAPLVIATALHDEGWRAWDEAPEARDGRPVDFTEIDRPTHVALYREGIRAARERDPRAGLLVSLHGQGLYEGRRGLDPGPPTPRAARPPAVRDFLDDQDRVQAGIRAADPGAAPGGRWEWAAYRLIQAWDALSLYLTWRALAAGRDGTLPQVPREPGDAGLDLHLSPDGPKGCIVHPWPFSADRVELPVAARAIEDRPYDSDAELRTALDGAPWFTLAFTVRPA